MYDNDPINIPDPISTIILFFFFFFFFLFITHYYSQNLSNNNLNLITFKLHNPYPSPFTPTTSISFSIPEQSQTSLKVYDIKGNLISTLLNQTMNVGHHQIEWNGENLSSGTYFIRINSGEFSDVKKVVLVK